MEPRISSLIIEPFSILNNHYSLTQPSITTPNGDVTLPNVQVSTPTKHHTKSAVSLAEVLNSDDEPRRLNGSLDYILQDANHRKRRKIDDTGRFHLPVPKPQQSAKPRQRLPPVLPPLLQPPSDAGLIPSITADASAGSAIDASGPAPAKPIANPHGDDEQNRREVSNKDTDIEAHRSWKRKRRRLWTDEETANLLQGVARFGIGSWKKILVHPEYSFNDRTAVDLKDRFRTCCPNEYRKLKSSRASEPQPPKQDLAFEGGESLSGLTPNEDTDIRHQAGPAKQDLDRAEIPDPSCLPSVELSGLDVDEPFRKNDRRERREFTVGEDEALLHGFMRHGKSWRKIRNDAELGLTHRTRTDLRDRFRNRYPDKYTEAGLKLHVKTSAQSLEQPRSIPTKDAATKSGSSQAAAHNPSKATNAASASGVAPSTRTATISLPQLLPLSFADDFMDDFPDFVPEDDNQVSLRRDVLDWADQHFAQMPITVPEPPGLTLSGLDLLHISPLATLRPLQTTSSHQSNPSATVQAQNSMAVSGLLTNGPTQNNNISLPPPTDLLLAADGGGLYWQ